MHRFINWLLVLLTSSHAKSSVLSSDGDIYKYTLILSSHFPKNGANGEDKSVITIE